MNKVAFHTLGCKVNQYETQAMTEMFIKAGYYVVNFEEFADVYVINTCTVTGLGDKKSRQVVRKAYRTNPRAVIAVCGCYSQISPEEASKIEGVSVVIGTKDRSKIVEMVEEASKEKILNNVSDVTKQASYEEIGFISFSETTRAFVKIQEGCQDFCSYCIIPYARGPIRSRLPENVKKEVLKLTENGFKEIVLTGININSYGKDIENTSLVKLIEEISKIDDIKRIRLGSINPNLITGDFVNFIKENKKVCPHFHISLQSGCDSVLKRMNRKYTTEQYEEKVNLLENSISDISVTTDIIVGFPGETEEEFEETYRFIERIPFTRMHVFKYSPRKGTPAASFEGQVSSQEKEKRSGLLIDLSDEKERAFFSKYLSREMEVLFEQKSLEGEGLIEGHTENFIRVIAKGKESLAGEFRMVRVEEVQKGFVRGVLVG